MNPCSGGGFADTNPVRETSHKGGRPRLHPNDRARWRANKAAARKAARVKAYHRRESDEWLTPPDLLAAVLRAAGRSRFDLDPCSPSHDGPVPAVTRWTQGDDGLAQPWAGLIWCNPPYSAAAKWTAHCAATASTGATVVALVPSRTGTRWWHANVAWRADVLLLPRRLKFARGDGRPAGTAPFDCALLVYGDSRLARRLPPDLHAHLAPAAEGDDRP